VGKNVSAARKAHLAALNQSVAAVPDAVHIQKQIMMLNDL
jgi:hypothetical protein